jgi:hypothetical protein
VLLTKYYLGVQARKMRWVGHVACMEEEKYAYSVLVGKPEGE